MSDANDLTTSMTPQQRADEAAREWWRIGRELHELKDDQGRLLESTSVLSGIIAAAIREAEAAAAVLPHRRCARIAKGADRCEGGGPWKTYAELEAEGARLKAALAAVLPYASASGIDSTEDYTAYYSALAACRSALALKE